MPGTKAVIDVRDPTVAGEQRVQPGDQANRAVRVSLVSGSIIGATQVDKSAFVEGVSAFAPVGGVVNETMVSDVSEDTAAAIRITPKRAAHVNLRTSAGVEMFLPRVVFTAGDGISTTTTGVKLTYTPPAGKWALIRGATWFNNAGAPTVRLEVMWGATTIVLQSFTAALPPDPIIVALQDGDTIQYNVTVAGLVGSNADATFSAQEQA